MPETKTDNLIRNESRAITTSTTVQLGLAILLCGTIWQGSRWAAGMEARFDGVTELLSHSVELLELKIEQVRRDISQRTDDRWRRSDEVAMHARYQQWAELRDARNPDHVSVPFPSMPPVSKEP